MLAILIVSGCLLAAFKPAESDKLFGDATWSQDSYDCPSGFTYVPEVKGCYQVVLSNLDWRFAGLRCKTLNKDAHLVVVNSNTEQVALANMLNTYSDSQLSGCFRHDNALATTFWTAGQRIDPGTASQFVWRMAQDVCYRPDAVSELRYTNWANGEPSCRSGRESCLQMCRGVGYAWNDESCSRASCSVCEIDLY